MAKPTVSKETLEKRKNKKVEQMRCWRKKEKKKKTLERSQMNEYEISRNKLISTASRAATKKVKSSDDPALWSHLFHTKMDLLAYEQVDAQPKWILRAVKEGKNLTELWEDLK